MKKMNKTVVAFLAGVVLMALAWVAEMNYTEYKETQAQAAEIETTTGMERLYERVAKETYDELTSELEANYEEWDGDHFTYHVDMRNTDVVGIYEYIVVCTFDDGMNLEIHELYDVVEDDEIEWFVLDGERVDSYTVSDYIDF